MPPKTNNAPTTGARKPRAAGGKSEVRKKRQPKKVGQAEFPVFPAKAHPEKPAPQKAGYVFATGRRKTAVANIRLYAGQGESLVNKKPLEDYFKYPFYLQEIEKPFNLTGQGQNYYFICSLSGGGMHAQAKALQHGLATALAKASPEQRKILKKNGLLTRDDRKKERKKPGLKRARRAPQWAKR